MKHEKFYSLLRGNKNIYTRLKYKGITFLSLINSVNEKLALHERIKFHQTALHETCSSRFD